MKKLIDWREQLVKEDPGAWEESYRQQVLAGATTDEEWWYTWLWHRMILPEEKHSLFNTEKPIIQAQWMGTKIVVQPNCEGKTRLVMVQIFGDNPYHPDFEYHAAVSEEERRFPSIGNPFIDEPNYKQWEKLLLVKLLNSVLDDQKGLTFIIDRYRQQFHHHG